MISSAVFLIVGGAFVFYLFKGIFQLIGQNLETDGLNGKAMIALFKIPLICFVILIVYVLWIFPYLTAQGLQ